MVDAKHVAACDYAGIVSGNDVTDKIEKVGNALADGNQLK